MRDQLSLADEVGLPVVIHSRDAHEETYEILSAWAEAMRREAPVGVIHCFSGDAALAHRYVALGFVISFAGPVTYPKNAALREAAVVAPADRLVVETDSPYLSPQRSLGYTDRSGRSIRGKRNEPAVVSETAAFIAELRGESVETLVANTSAATRTLFRLRVGG